MASAITQRSTRITLEEHDLQSLRQNGLLAVSHPHKRGIIMLATSSADPPRKDTDGVLATPLLTGNSFTRLNDGETLQYCHGKITVRKDPEQVA
jgi:hypothetical protein